MGDFVTAREFDQAIQFLSEKIDDDGFKVTHEKQDKTQWPRPGQKAFI